MLCTANLSIVSDLIYVDLQVIKCYLNVKINIYVCDIVNAFESGFISIAAKQDIALTYTLEVNYTFYT